MIEIKILHICQYYNDGWGYQENLLPRYQAKLGHEVVVITSDRRPYYMGDSNPRIIGTGTFCDDGVRIERLPIKWEFRNRFVIFKDLMNILEKEKPNYIFHHGLTMPSLIIASKYKKNYPNTFLAADNHADYHNSGKWFLWRQFYYRLFWRKTLARISDNIDIFFSVTPSCKQFAENELGIPSQKHKLLYLGADVDTNYFSPEERTNIRNRFHLNDEDFVVITAGKIDKMKRTDQIVRAIKEIKDKSIRLLIVGSIEKNYELFLDELIDGDNRIIKTRWIEAGELYKYFSAADIAVFPGGQSATWQQAISCELPLIIRYWPGVEYLLSANNGILMVSEDYRELKQYLELLISNPELIKEMSKNSKKLVEETLSYDIIAKQSIEIVPRA